MFGFLNVYKPKGMTSHDVVSVLRRVTKIKQIGHTGTLDPFAEGVLPICIGKATRLIEYLADDKAYVGTVQLGKSTTTFDIEGEVVNSSSDFVSREEVETALEKFRGEILQVPPIYSAIKVQGKKLYEYAREGKEIEIQPRKVNISQLEIREFDYEKQTVSLYIECSKGTYIRSIANDLGKELGVWGHLIKLERVKAGRFEVSDSIKLEDLDSLEKVKTNLLYPAKLLDYPIYELNEIEEKKVSNGMKIACRENLQADIVVLMYQNRLAAVAKLEENYLKCLKVF